MPLLTLPVYAFREELYNEIKARTRALAGPPPAPNYQGHQLVEIRLSLGELAISNIGRYSAKCVHPGHRDHQRYPNCHRVRMVTPPLQDIEFEHLRLKIARYVRITHQAWGLAQWPSRAQPISVIDVDSIP